MKIYHIVIERENDASMNQDYEVCENHLTDNDRDFITDINDESELHTCDKCDMEDW